MDTKRIGLIVLAVVVVVIGLVAMVVKEKFNYRSIRPMFSAYDSSHPFVPKPQPDLDYVQTSVLESADMADRKKVDCAMRRLFYNGKC
jgi:hypothetical protein